MTGTSIAIISGGAKLANVIGKGLGRIMSNGSIPPNGKLAWLLTLVSGVVIGAAANVCLHQVENMTDSIDKNSWQNDENLGEEISSGAVSGVLLSLYMSITKFISNPIKKAFKLNPQDVFVAKNGAANVANTVMATALAEGASGAVASTAMSDGKYLINCATDEEKEFSWSDLAQTTVVSAIAGVAINSIFGAFKGFSGARAFNKDLNLNQINSADELVSKEVGPWQERQTPKEFVKKNCQSCVKRKIKSEFQQRLKLAFSKKPNTAVIKSAKKPGIVFIKDNANDPRSKNAKLIGTFVKLESH